MGVCIYIGAGGGGEEVPHQEPRRVQRFPPVFMPVDLSSYTSVLGDV